MNKHTFLILAIVVAVCGITAPKSHAKPTFRVGALLSLTGDCADVGDMSRQGIELAIEQINQSGGILGKSVELVLEDTVETRSSNAVTAFRRMLLNPDLRYFVGPSCTPAGLAIAPLAASNSKIIIASPSIGLRQFNETGSNIFKLWPYDEKGPKIIARYAIEQGWKTAAIFSSQQGWELAQGNWVEKEFKRLGGKILAKVEPLPGDSDLRSEALKLISGKPDVIFLTNYLNFDVAARELAKAGYKGPKLSSLMTREKIDLAAGALEGTVSWGYKSASEKFKQQFTTRYGTQPSGISADTAFDIMHLYANAINESNTSNPAVIRKKLLEVKNYSGASGNLSIDKNGGVLREPILFTVRGKDLIPLQ